MFESYLRLYIVNVLSYSPEPFTKLFPRSILGAISVVEVFYMKYFYKLLKPIPVRVGSSVKKRGGNSQRGPRLLQGGVA